MSMLKVVCEDQKLYIAEFTTIASGGVNETKVHFEFCPKWDGFVKTAVFYQNVHEPHYAVVNEDNIAVIPWEATQTPGFMYFGVFGVKDGVNRTSKVLRVRIEPGAITNEIAPADPTPDIYIQILSDYNNIISQMLDVGDFVNTCKNEISELTEECKNEIENLNTTLFRPFENKVVSVVDWVEDTTYDDFPFRAAIACEGVTEGMFPEVVFSPKDALGGIFCPVSHSYNGGVYIFATEKPSESVSIPVIICSLIV